MKRTTQIILMISFLAFMSLMKFAMAANPSSVDLELQQLKLEMITLNKEMMLLEQTLSYPDNQSISIFLSIDVESQFNLFNIKILINDDVVNDKDYSDREIAALEQGGVQRIYVGSLVNGLHNLTAFMTGTDAEGETYKRGVTVSLMKQKPTQVLELKVGLSEYNRQAKFFWIEL